MKRPSNRKGKSGSFNGSTLQIFKRISEGKGRCFLEKKRRESALRHSYFRSGGAK